MSSSDKTTPVDPVVNIVGERIMLGPLSRDLIPTYLRWANDFQTTRTLAIPPRPLTVDTETEWFEQSSRGGTDRACFTIYERSTGRPIGNTEWFNIDHRHRTAEFGLLIGEQDARGHGYGTSTTRLMLDYAFHALGLHSVRLEVYSFNLAAQRVYEKAGFKVCGRWRESRRLGDTAYDVIAMDCLASEFSGTVLASVFMPDQPSF